MPIGVSCARRRSAVHRPIIRRDLRGLACAWALALAMLGCDRSDTTPPDPAEEPDASATAKTAPAAGNAEPEPGSAEPSGAPKPPPLPTSAAAGTCPESGENQIGILVSPSRPSADRPLRVVVATLADETPLAIRLEGEGGEEIEAEVVHRLGVPSAVLARVAAPPKGPLRVVVGRDGEGLRCAKAKIAAAAPPARPRPASDRHVWPVDRAWTAAEEALFSAWVRELFWAPRGEDLAWKALHEVTSDADRNVLHDHLGWGEDAADTREGLYLKPDCADAPYFLRAYFAWKRGLPFGFRKCSRGGGGKAPWCGALNGVLSKPDAAADAKPGELGVVQRYFRRTLAWGVHSGNGRTAFDNEATDFYPVTLSRRSLRPGIIYADPYGHIFVMIGLVPAQGDDPGILYAIDGQPDGSITRKRFWEGNFLWNPDPALGGSGFKAFRPVALDTADGGRAVVSLSDAQIGKHPAYGDISPAQAQLDGPGFYDEMDALINPGRRDPIAAQREAVFALFEAAKVRVTSVDNGEGFMAKGGGTIAMPNGHSIFETTGAWENYSTPARDLRLLIAIDIVVGFEDKVARNAEVFLAKGESMETLRERLREHRETLLRDPSLSFSYTRSDGSSWPLSVADIIARKQALQVGYNPNDCPEVRWGAPAGSAERKPCKRRAPAEQQRKMAAYAEWFAQRRRPARGDPGPPVQ
jgi:hypothetical protein